MPRKSKRSVVLATAQLEARRRVFLDCHEGVSPQVRVARGTNSRSRPPMTGRLAHLETAGISSAAALIGKRDARGSDFLG